MKEIEISLFNFRALGNPGWVDPEPASVHGCTDIFNELLIENEGN
jgi:hypothetical protein